MEIQEGNVRMKITNLVCYVSKDNKPYRKFANCQYGLSRDEKIIYLQRIMDRINNKQEGG